MSQQLMSARTQIKVWCDSVYKTAIAKTKGTFDAVDANAATVILAKPDVKALIGFIINYNTTLVTDAQNQPDLIVQVTNQALGISAEEFVVPNGGCDGNATNDWAPLTYRFIPWKTTLIDKLFNSEFSFKVAPSITNTGGQDVAIGVVFASAEPDAQFQMELMSQMHKRAEGGDVEADAAKAHGTANAFVTLTGLTIPSGHHQLVGLLAKINPNAITASKPIGGVFKFTASGIPDFDPQIWPYSTHWNPVLGTTVSEQSQGGNSKYYPTRFPLTGARTAVTVQTLLLVAASDAPDTTQALLYER